MATISTTSPVKPFKERVALRNREARLAPR